MYQGRAVLSLLIYEKTSAGRRGFLIPAAVDLTYSGCPFIKFSSILTIPRLTMSTRIQFATVIGLTLIL